MIVETISVLNTLSDDIRERLQKTLLTDVGDLSQATYVVKGILRGFVRDHEIQIMVRKGDDLWEHTLNVSSQNVGMQAPLGEIGGNLYWRRRYTIGLDLRFDAQVDQEEADEIAHVVLSRTEWALQNKDSDTGSWWFSLEEDDFGEHASRIQIMNSFMIESGGDNAWRWNGKVMVEFMTEKPGCV